jgi:hypothetical protein
MNTISGRQKAGLGLALFLNVANFATAFFPTPEGEEGPPTEVLIVGAILAIIGTVGAVIAWRTGKQVGFRIAAGALVINAIASLPAFFVEVPAGVKLAVAVSLVITVTSIVLMFSTARRAVPVLD